MLPHSSMTTVQASLAHWRCRVPALADRVTALLQHRLELEAAEAEPSPAASPSASPMRSSPPSRQYSSPQQRQYSSPQQQQRKRRSATESRSEEDDVSREDDVMHDDSDDDESDRGKSHAAKQPAKAKAVLKPSVKCVGVVTCNLQ